MAHGSALGSGSRSFDNQTVRQIVTISVGGTRVRVKLSNEYGEAPLIVGSAHVAMHATGASIVPDSDRTLTFRGRTAVTIPQGGVALSDPVNLNVPSNSSLAISLYLPQNTGFATYHENATQTAYISGPGDFSDAIDLPVQEPPTISRYWLTFVEVLPQKRVGALAIIGDSISEGATTTLDANRRVTDVLSRRLNPPGSPPRLAVLNQATGCGRLLTDFCGPSGVSRFERDVLNATGITRVLIELGYVDIIFPTAAGIPAEIVSAEQITAGIRQLALRARMRGLNVYGATLTPNEGTPFPNVHTPENEAKRQAVNQWIRTWQGFDAVVDYDLALRDPSRPARLLPAYAAPDNIHPNDAGHEALARAIARALH
jgi:lysophospholipase L1-like esterase